MLADDPLVTIVVTFRERFSTTPRCLDQLVQNTGIPYRLTYVSSGAPAYIQAYLERTCAEHGFELITTAETLPPNTARNLGLKRATTRYVVFLDNDVLVESGWLQAMLECAEETGWDVVGSTVLIGEPGRGIVHTLGGDFRKRKNMAGRRWLDEMHRFDNVNLRLNPSKLARSEADYVEFHCLLARTSVFDKTGPLDQQVLAASEHIDFAHATRRHGGHIVVEPKAVVSYLADAAFTFADVPFFEQRWSHEWMESSIERFREKRAWPGEDDSPLYDEYRSFAVEHRRLCDAMRPGVAPTGLISTGSHPFAQTILQLTGQLSRSGLVEAEVEQVMRAYQTAQFLFDGIYRENGRSLLEHAVGTTSVLAAYGAPLNVLCAALLHAAYSLGRFPVDLDGNLPAARRWLEGRIGVMAEQLVYATYRLDYDALREELLQDDEAPIRVCSAFVLLLRIANSIDEHLDGGLLYTANPSAEIERNRKQNEAWHQVYRRAASLLGCTAMHDLLLVLNTEIAGHALTFVPPPPLAADNLRFGGEEVSSAARSWPAVSEATATQWLEPQTWLLEQLQPRLGEVLRVYGLHDVEPANGGSVQMTPGFPLSLFAQTTMQIATPPVAWSFAALLRLDPAGVLCGEAFVRVYLQVKTGDLEVLLVGHDFAVLEAINRALRSEDDKVELWFHVPDLKDAAAVVFRSRTDAACKARILDVSLHAVEAAGNATAHADESLGDAGLALESTAQGLDELVLG